MTEAAVSFAGNLTDNTVILIGNLTDERARRRARFRHGRPSRSEAAFTIRSEDAWPVS